MSRLTLEWHLRGIRDGTTEPILVRQDIEPDNILGGWKKTGRRYYTDPTVEGYEQSTQAGASSYTTGFTQESGDFCDCFDIDVSRALRTDDTVRYLDKILNDPTVRYQTRYDAAQLLNHHIWPESPMNDDRIPVRRDDIDSSEWKTRRRIGPMVHPSSCVNPECSEVECLVDPDTLRETGQVKCMVCGTEQ